MAIWNLGSINIDLVYSVPHLPAAGETIASTKRSVFLGGKGANMSVAAVRAEARVNHIGAVGGDGLWTIERLQTYGVDVSNVAQVDLETAHAMIFVDKSGENSIILHPSANASIPNETLNTALSNAQPGDWFVTQNETNQQPEGVKLAKKLGLKVAYAAAPFDVDAIDAVLPFLDLLILNEVEMAQLNAAKGVDAESLGIDTVIVTKGSQGSEVFQQGKDVVSIPSIPVEPVDTTGAGDTFTGYVLAGLDQGMTVVDAMSQATRAAALMVTRHGTADVIPTLSEVKELQPHG